MGATTVGADERRRRFALWLAEQIERREWTRTEFAKRGSFTTGQVSMWCNAQRMPRPPQLQRIAGTLGLGLDAVLAAAGVRPDAEELDDDRAAVMGLLRHIRLTPDRAVALESLLRSWHDADRRDDRRN